MSQFESPFQVIANLGVKIDQLETQRAEEHEAHGEAMNRAFADFQKVQQVLAESQAREQVLRKVLEDFWVEIEKALKMPYDDAELKVAKDLSYRKGVEDYIDAVRQAKKEALLKAMEWFYEDEQYVAASSLRRMAKYYK